MSFVDEQIKKEVSAGKRIWRVLLMILVIYWGVMGLFMIIIPGLRLLGLVFALAAGYVLWRLKKAKNENK